MSTNTARRAVLIGTDTARLLGLAGELEARGLEVAVYRDVDRGLRECVPGQCDVLVALGRARAGAGTASALEVPLVQIDVAEAPELPVRPLGPRTVLGADASAATVAERAVALMAAREAPTPALAPLPEPPEAPAAAEAPPAPSAAAPEDTATDAPARVDLATLWRERAAAAESPVTLARPRSRRWTRLLRWAAIVLAGIALGYLVGMAYLNAVGGR